MGLEIPDEVKWLSWIIGQDWPEGDETAMRRLATAWEDAATGVDELTGDVQGSATKVLSVVQGPAADNFREFWDQFVTTDPQYLPKLSELCRSLAKQCDDGAAEIEYGKYMFIALLIITAIQIAFLIANMIETFGASAAAIPVVEEGAQVVAKSIARKLLEALLKNIALAELQSVGLDVLIQGIQVAEGHRDGFDWSKTGAAAVDGLVNGVIGTGVGLGAGKIPGLSGAATPFKGMVQGAAREAVSGAVSGVAGAVATTAIHGGDLSPEALAKAATSGGFGGGVGGAKGGMDEGAHAAGEHSPSPGDDGFSGSQNESGSDNGSHSGSDGGSSEPRAGSDDSGSSGGSDGGSSDSGSSGDGGTSQPHVTSDGGSSGEPHVTSDGGGSEPHTVSDGGSSEPHVTSDSGSSSEPHVTSDGGTGTPHFGDGGPNVDTGGSTEPHVVSDDGGSNSHSESDGASRDDASFNRSNVLGTDRGSAPSSTASDPQSGATPPTHDGDGPAGNVPSANRIDSLLNGGSSHDGGSAPSHGSMLSDASTSSPVAAGAGLPDRAGGPGTEGVPNAATAPTGPAAGAMPMAPPMGGRSAPGGNGHAPAERSGGSTPTSRPSAAGERPSPTIGDRPTNGTGSTRDTTRTERPGGTDRRTGSTSDGRAPEATSPEQRPFSSSEGIRPETLPESETPRTPAEDAPGTPADEAPRTPADRIPEVPRDEPPATDERPTAGESDRTAPSDAEPGRTGSEDPTPGEPEHTSTQDSMSGRPGDTRDPALREPTRDGGESSPGEPERVPDEGRIGTDSTSTRDAGTDRAPSDAPGPRTDDAPRDERNPAPSVLSDEPGARPHAGAPAEPRSGTEPGERRTGDPRDDSEPPAEPGRDDPSPGHDDAEAQHHPDDAGPHHQEVLTPDEVNERHSEPTPAGSSYHRGDAEMGDLPQRVAPDPEGRYSVDVHITPDGLARIGEHTYTPEQFADVLRHNGDYNGEPIRLIGCDAGSNDFARRLAHDLGAPVMAPDKPAWTDSAGRVFSSDSHVGPDGKLKPEIPPNGEWTTHNPDDTTSKASDDGFAPGTKDEDKRDGDGEDARHRGDEDPADGRTDRPPGHPNDTTEHHSGPLTPREERYQEPARSEYRQNPQHQVRFDPPEVPPNRVHDRVVEPGRPFVGSEGLEPNSRYNVIENRTGPDGEPVRRGTFYTGPDGKVTHADTYSPNLREDHPDHVPNPDAQHPQPDAKYRVEVGGHHQIFSVGEDGRPQNAVHFDPPEPHQTIEVRPDQPSDLIPPHPHKPFRPGRLEPNTKYEVTDSAGNYRGAYYTDHAGEVHWVETEAGRGSSQNLELKKIDPDVHYVESQHFDPDRLAPENDKFTPRDDAQRIKVPADEGPNGKQAFINRKDLEPNARYEVYSKNGEPRGIFYTDENGKVRIVDTYRPFNPDLNNPLPNTQYSVDHGKWQFETGPENPHFANAKPQHVTDTCASSGHHLSKDEASSDYGRRHEPAQGRSGELAGKATVVAADGKISSKNINDGGHTQGSQFGSPGELINMISQLRDENQGNNNAALGLVSDDTWHAMEKQVALTAEQPGVAIESFDVFALRDAGEQVPHTVQVRYVEVADGKVTVRVRSFPNVTSGYTNGP